MRDEFSYPPYSRPTVKECHKEDRRRSRGSSDGRRKTVRAGGDDSSSTIVIGHIPRVPTTPTSNSDDRDF